MKDLNKLPTDGYIIFPLSVSRLQGDQSPKKCMEYLEILDKKVQVPGNDVVFLYTNGLYFNAKEEAHLVRKRTNSQMLAHRNSLKKLINKKGSPYMPTAFHFLPFDYVILNCEFFKSFFDKLQEKYKKDSKFAELIDKVLGKRKKERENIDFILEELAVSHIIRYGLVEFPKTLVKDDKFRLIIYPDPETDVESYIEENNLLSRKKTKILGRYYNSVYDPKNKLLYKLTESIGA